MNTRRIIFWLGFVIVLGLIVWGLVVAMNKPVLGVSLNDLATVTAMDHITGPIDAPITIIEYSDFQCSACEIYYYFVKRLLEESPMSIRFVYRQFPLPQTQHPNAFSSAIASEAAGVQGKFFEMYAELFENHAEWTELTDPTSIFIGYAVKIGLNVDGFKADMSSSTLRAKVQADSDGGIKVGINSTPTFFVNGIAITNPPTYEEFKTLIQTITKNSSK